MSLIRSLSFLVFILLPSIALAAIAQDGSAFTSIAIANTTLSTTGVTTAVSGDIVIVGLHNTHVTGDGCGTPWNTPTVTSGTGLSTFTQRGTNYNWHPGNGSAWDNYSWWWAYASGTLSSVTITATINQAGCAHNYDAASMVVILFKGFTGANYHAPGGVPFDPNVSLPANALQTTNTATNATVTYTVTNASSMPLAFYGTSTNVGIFPSGAWTSAGTADEAAGTNWSIQGILFGPAASGSTTPNTSATTASWFMGGDALTPAGTANAPTNVVGSPSLLMGCCQ